jgi:hypothetical protein
MLYENPWSDVEGFTFLGTYESPAGYGTIELYALTKPDYLSNYAGVALGARYGNDGGDYLSGRFNDKPLRSEGLSDYPIDEARRRFAALLAK